MTLPSGHSGAPPPEPKPRPGSVTAAGIMMPLLSLVSLAWAAILTISFLVASEELLKNNLRRTEPGVGGEQLDTMVSLTKGLGYAAAALIAVLGIALAVLAVPVVRGSRVARILTWVITGVHLLCGLGAVVSVGASATSGIRGNGFVVAVPLFTLLSAVCVIILLTLPASNRYFARPVAWHAPTGFGPATPPAAPPPADQPDAQDLSGGAAPPLRPEQP
jgi:hypothetical protein